MNESRPLPQAQDSVAAAATAAPENEKTQTIKRRAAKDAENEKAGEEKKGTKGEGKGKRKAKRKREGQGKESRSRKKSRQPFVGVPAQAARGSKRRARLRTRKDGFRGARAGLWHLPTELLFCDFF